MIVYYTDGSASPNPGPGGFAVIKNGVPYMLGGEPSGDDTTNIRMEGLAIKTALADADGQECQIFTDSEFWINVITKWAPSWAANGWKKKGGEIKNLDIVQTVFPLYQTSRATLTWVRGHEGDEGNEMADEWANKARERRATNPVLLEAPRALTPAEYAHEHLRAGRTMQLATVRQGRPAVCSVYYVPSDDDKAVYWTSIPERRHSQDIVADCHVAGAIAVKTEQPVMGLQFSGTAEVVSDLDEMKRVMDDYSTKYDGQGKDLYDNTVAGTSQHKLYRLTIESLELFDMVHYPGQFPVVIA